MLMGSLQVVQDQKNLGEQAYKTFFYMQVDSLR